MHINGQSRLPIYPVQFAGHHYPALPPCTLGGGVQNNPHGNTNEPELLYNVHG